MYKYTALNSRYYPKFSDILKIIRKAEDEDVTSRDARPLLFCLKRMSLVNGRIRGHIVTRKSAICSFDWEIAPDDKSDAAEVLSLKSRLKQAINQIIRSYVECPLYGAVALKTDWINDTAAGGWKTALKKLDIYDVEQEGDGVRIVTDNGGSITKTELYLPELTNKYIIATDGDPYAGGTLKSIFITEVLRHELRLEFANFTRKLQGILQAMIKGAATDDERKIVEDTMRGAIEGRYMVTDDLVELKVNEVVGSQVGDAFKVFIEAACAEIAIAILGQANTSELPSSGGSYAALRVQQLISADIMWQDINALESIINDQLLRQEFMLSHATGGTPWRFRFKLAEERNIETEAAAITEIRTAGIPLKKSEVYDRLGYSQPAEGDEVFEPLVQGAM